MADEQNFKYCKDYREKATLRDGRVVLLRLVRPSDRDELKRGFDRASPETRYRRFLSPKQELSERELTYLTEVDGYDHFALGALFREKNGKESGVAIGRFVRLDDDPETAEPAIVVLDEFHGKGLGTLMLQHLQAAAAERGVKRFRSELLAENTAMKAVLDDISPDAEYAQGGDGIAVVTFDVNEDSVPAKKETDHTGLARAVGAIHRLLGHVATERVAVVQRQTIPPPEPD